MAGIIKSFDPTAKASAVSFTTGKLNLETAPAQRPEVIAVIGGYALAKTAVVDDVPILADGTPEQAFSLFGASPLYYAATKLFPKNGNGAKCPVYYVPVNTGESGGPVSLDITVSGTATKSFTIQVLVKEDELASAADAVGKIATNALFNPAVAPRGIALDGFNYVGFTVRIAKGSDAGDVASAILAAATEEPWFPLTASVPGGSPEIVNMSQKYLPTAAGYGLTVLMEDGTEVTSAATGISFVVDQGIVSQADADLTDALANLTEDLGITRIVNQFSDGTNLGRIQDWAEALRAGRISQWAMSYFGKEYTEDGTTGTVDVATMKTYGDGRRLDSVNVMIPGNYGDLRPLTWYQRDMLLKAGITNIELRNGVPTLMDVVTFYHPVGDTNPLYAKDESITKIGNIAYDALNYYHRAEWDQKVIVADSGVTVNPAAIDIKDFLASVFSRAELWERVAWIADANFVKNNSTAEIDGTNPGRINANIQAQLSSTLSIIDITSLLGFYFGATA